MEIVVRASWQMKIQQKLEYYPKNDSELIMILKLTVDSEYLADENIDDNIERFGKKSLNRTPYSPRITLRENWRDPVLVRPWGPVELASHQPLDIITMVNPY